MISLPEAPTAPPGKIPDSRTDRAACRRGIHASAGGRLALPLRAGYAYEATPVPPQSGNTSFLDATRHLLSLGVGMEVEGLDPVLLGGLCLDLALQWGLLEDRSRRRRA
jgi:long-chain fatty acid transport protein